MNMDAPDGGIERIGKKQASEDSRGDLILTGIRSLDQKLGMELATRRGIPQGSFILVSYPPGTVIPTLFIQRILLNWAQQSANNVIFYVHSSRPYDHVYLFQVEFLII